MVMATTLAATRSSTRAGVMSQLPQIARSELCVNRSTPAAKVPMDSAKRHGMM